MHRRIEPLRIAGPAGALEAQLLSPERKRAGAALVCHPHPRHGGTMHTKAVYHAARGAARSGIPVLRFQFRGVGTSAGRYTAGPGERADARAALRWLASRYPGEPLLAGGFSFGAWVGLAAAVEHDAVKGLYALAPPLRMYDFEFVGGERPLLCVAGDRDAFVSPDALRDFAARRDAECVLLPGAEHLLVTHLAALEDAVASFTARVLDSGRMHPTSGGA